MLRLWKGTNATAEEKTPDDTVYPYGLRIIADPDGATEDIVFVHGITGNREKTWTHDDKTFWPEAFLARDFTKTRIMTFGYDASVTKLFGQSSSNTLRDHGRTLCSDLAMLRLRTSSNGRDLLFIAHSLGGLVCEQALLISSGAPEDYYRAMIECTLGIMFMGTPHAGADTAKLASILGNLVGLVKQVNSDIVGVLKPDSEVLAGLQQEFHRLLKQRAKNSKPEIKLFCFYEELPVTGIGTIVERRSAILASDDCIGLHANHMDLAKFDRSEAGYSRLRDRLFVWLNVERPERAPISQPKWLTMVEKMSRPGASDPIYTGRRLEQMAELAYELYQECGEMIELRPLERWLGSLNLQFRTAKNHLNDGVLNKLMQDMLLNICDGCYHILGALQRQLQQHHKGETNNTVAWEESQISLSVGFLKEFDEGLHSLNAKFKSKSYATVIEKFLAYVQAVKAGTVLESTLSQSWEYVTAEDGESDAVWDALRQDLQATGISARLIDMHRPAITKILEQLIKSGEFTLSDSSSQFLSAAEELSAVEPLDTLIRYAGEDDNTYASLHFAASKGHLPTIQHLLAQGADVNARDSKNYSPLRYALENGHHGAMRIMLEHEPSNEAINAKIDDLDNTLLHLAVRASDADAALILLNSGADASAGNKRRQTPLHLATWNRDPMLVKQLLDSEACIDVQDFWGDTPFDMALDSPINLEQRSAIIRQFLEARQLRGEDTPPGISIDDVVLFLEMQSIFDRRSEVNIFKTSADGGSIAELLPRQFAMDDLAEELWDSIFGPASA